MVDRELRTRGKQLIDQFLACAITNDDFDDESPCSRGDPALAGIHRVLWLYCDDRYTHYLNGKHCLGPKTHAIFRRCIAFLDSDVEYEWPRSFPVIGGLTLILMRFLALRNKAKERERLAAAELEKIGDLDVWPFVRQTDYQEAISHFH